jgi:methionyl-tRNA formyltransferase
MTARIIFMGTPDFAVPALESLAARSGHEVMLVVTQPDRPSGRGRKLRASPVASAAERLGLPVYRVSSLRDAAARQPIVDAAPDLIVVAAFGLILGRTILTRPSTGCLNLHASLLPAYRGANPIAMAIRDGMVVTGVSLMRMEPSLDTGPVFGQESVVVRPDDTTETLTRRLSHGAAEVLDRNLDGILSGQIAPVPQAGGATCTRPMTKDDGWIDWILPAAAIERHVRAMWPWPRAWTTLPDDRRLQVHRCHVVDDAPGPPGQLRIVSGSVTVSCGEGALALNLVQMPGGKPAPASTLVSTRSLDEGAALGTADAPASLPPLVAPC